MYNVFMKLIIPSICYIYTSRFDLNFIHLDSVRQASLFIIFDNTLVNSQFLGNWSNTKTLPAFESNT